MEGVETGGPGEMLDSGWRVRHGWGLGGLAWLFGCAMASAGEPASPGSASAARGREAVHGPLNPAYWTMGAYENAWRRWGVDEKPEDYPQAFRERYGLHPAPYENDGLPMGFHRTGGVLVLGRGLGNDCLLCHSGRVAGRTIIGLGNTALDMQSLYEDLLDADGLGPTTPLTFGNVRGTTAASVFPVYLMQFRDAELGRRLPSKFDVCATLSEDPPAWWLLRKKRTIYHGGGVDARSVRTMMPFLLHPLHGPEAIKKLEPAFADIRAFLLTLEPPRYPFPIAEGLSARGKVLFEANCARCHGTYGPGGRYPNKVIPLDEIGTDPTLARAFPADALEHYLRSWFARERGPGGESYYELTDGYQAPPLDGLWATAPYLHNGSVPTVGQVLDSRSRPTVFTRSFRGEVEDYDPRRLGWKVVVLDGPPDPALPAIERRKVFDTRRPGLGNGGHRYGDGLTDDERSAVIEYLKTL